MSDARCSCGDLTLSITADPKTVIVCHCIECQRRTGAPFGVGAFFPAEAVMISGVSTEFTRPGASGGAVHTYFCPKCGSTVYWRADSLPGVIGVAVGALVEPHYPAPARSIFEDSKHRWVVVDAGEHFQQGSLRRTAV